MSTEMTKALGKLIGHVINFVLDLVIIKLGWDGVLVVLFPTLPIITWFQALILFWICAALFKQKTVSIISE